MYIYNKYIYIYIYTYIYVVWKETNHLVEVCRFILEHGEESLKVSIEQVNMFHSAINFTAEYSKEEADFLDVNIKLIDGDLKTNLFVKPTDASVFRFNFLPSLPLQKGNTLQSSSQV